MLFRDVNLDAFVGYRPGGGRGRGQQECHFGQLDFGIFPIAHDLQGPLVFSLGRRQLALPLHGQPSVEMGAVEPGTDLFVVRVHVVNGC